MNRPYTILLAITAVSTLVVAALVLIVPDHTGELRTDLEVGDYYVLHSINGKIDIRYQIAEIRDDGTLDVEVSSQGTDPKHFDFTPEQYLQRIYLNDKGAVKDGNKRAMIETLYGERVCSLYKMDLSDYWVDSHNIIFRSFVSGAGNELVECSLIIQ